MVWTCGKDGRRETSEENYECSNGRETTSGKTEDEMEGCTPERSGHQWPEHRGGETGVFGPRPVERSCAGLMRLQCRGELSQVSQVSPTRITQLTKELHDSITARVSFGREFSDPFEVTRARLGTGISYFQHI